MSAIIAIQASYQAAQALGKTPESKRWAAENDKACHAELNALRAKACNSECFDCTALKPGWAVLPHGIFVCIDCAQVHRNLGRHISQTKAVNTGTYLWFEHEMAVMRAVGNGVAGKAYSNSAPKKPSRDASPTEKMGYARAKYEERRWGPHYDSAAFPLDVPPVPGPIMSAPRTPVRLPVKEGKKALHATRARALLSAESAEADLISLAPDTSHGFAGQSDPGKPKEGRVDSADVANFADFTHFEQANSNAVVIPPPKTPVSPAAMRSTYDQKKQQVLALYGCTPASQTGTFRGCAHAIGAGRPYDAGSFFAEYGL